MAKATQDEWDIDIPESPITPTEEGRAAKESSYQSNGWKFYIKVRPYLSEYWREFNGTVDRKGRNKYRTVREFTKDKFKKSVDRDLFYLMVCPYEEWQACARTTTKPDSKMSVPWLGDWYKRRKNGYWQEDNSIYIKSLRKAIKENLNSTEAIKATAPFLVQEMMRYSRLQSKVEEAFSGEPFLQDAPTSPANRLRFKTYLRMLQVVTGLKIRLIQEWMRVHGVNPNEPNQMWNMAALAQMSGQIGAAGALTGVAAAQGIMLSNADGSSPTMLSRDALLLADGMLAKTREFKMKDKEVILDGDELVTKEKTNGKSNGKHAVV